MDSFLDFRKGSLLERLEGAADRFRCWCPTCGHSSLCRFGDARYWPHAVMHSAHVIRNLSDTVLTRDAAAAPGVWARMARAALESVEEIAEATQVPLKAQPYVRDWAAMA